MLQTAHGGRGFAFADGDITLAMASHTPRGSSGDQLRPRRIDVGGVRGS